MLRKLLEGVTDGPWRSDDKWLMWAGDDDDGNGAYSGDEISREDLRFIADARNLWPAICELEEGATEAMTTGRLFTLDSALEKIARYLAEPLERVEDRTPYA